MKARAARDWTAWCATLSARLVEDTENEAKLLGLGPSCPKGRAAEAKSVPSSTFENTLGGPIAALRVKEEKGYALYHGTDGKNYVIEMKHEEDGSWKVDGYAPILLQ